MPKPIFERSLVGAEGEPGRIIISTQSPYNLWPDGPAIVLHKEKVLGLEGMCVEGRIRKRVDLRDFNYLPDL